MKTAQKTIQFEDFTLDVTYSYHEPERETGYPGSYEITEVMYQQTIPSKSYPYKEFSAQVNILPFIVEFSDDAFAYIEEWINEDFTEKIADGVFENNSKKTSYYN